MERTSTSTLKYSCTFVFQESESVSVIEAPSRLRQYVSMQQLMKSYMGYLFAKYIITFGGSANLFDFYKTKFDLQLPELLEYAQWNKYQKCSPAALL